MPATYKLHLLEITDFKRIKFAQIRFAEGLTILGGKNAQGKTSAIDALVATLGGKSVAPTVPVRKGQEKAELNLVLEGPNGKVFARRYFTESGGTNLEVKNEEGFKASSPQKLFDSFLGAFALDPLAFTRVDSRKQVEIFKKAFGVDTTAIDARRKEAYDERTVQNRIVRDLEGRYRDMPEAPEGTPDEEVAASDVSAEMSEAQAANDRASAAQFEAESKAQKLAGVDEAITKQEESVENIRRHLAAEEAKLSDWKARRGDVEKAAIAAQKVAEGLTKVDVAPIMARLQDVERTNAAVRAKKDRERSRALWEEAKTKAVALTEAVEAADREKAEALKAIDLPVEGLAFDEDGLYLNGIPFEQASSAEQLRVSVPLAFAQNSALKFAIIRDGSLLDDESMDLVAKLVDEAGGQLIVERVGDSDESAIVFEDGAVRGQQMELAGVA